LLALVPNATQDWIYRATVLRALNRNDEALAACDEALSCDSASADAWQEKLRALCALGRWEEALKAAETAEQQLPEDAKLREVSDWVERQVRRTVEDHTLTLRDGRKLGYIDIGDSNGPVILACHGMPGSRLDFANHDPVLRSLGVRLIAPDRPGYGLSDF